MRRSQVRSKVTYAFIQVGLKVAVTLSHYFLVTPLQCNSLQPSFQSLQLLCFWIRAKPPTHCYLPLRVITESMVNIWELDIIIDIDAGLRT